MSTKALMREIYEKSSGVKAINYFKRKGFIAGEAKPNSPARARAIKSLFTAPEPFIYKNDLIAGSLRPIKLELSDEETAEADRIVNEYGDRHFWTNSDHYAPDYKTTVEIGIPGLLEKIDISAEEHKNEAEKVSFLADMKVALTALRDMILLYADKADELVGKEGYDEEKLRAIAANCRAVATRKPQSFYEALQLVWSVHLAFCYEGRYAMALGRLDKYLYPFYEKDIAEGRLTEERATELIEAVFAKIGEVHSLFGYDDVVNICIGGSSPDGSCDVNPLSYCILRAVNNCHIPGPNLSARITHDTPDEFLDECLKVIGTGIGYPALMNDEVNIKALGKFGYADEDVHNFCMVGCIENFIQGCQRPWSDGRFDAPRFFEYVLNGGRGIMDPNAAGVDTGSIDGITSMDELMKRFEIQLVAGAESYVTNFKKASHIEAPMDYSSPFLSCFCRDCIGRGLDINNGGSLYPSVHGAAVMGIGTVSDSLAAIEKVVFVDRDATIEDIKNAMLANFEGYEWLREKLIAAPKYGNNDDFVDKYAVWFTEFLSKEFGKYKTEDGGNFYTLMAANTANIYAGATTAATPDGRKAGEPLSDAASPTYGRDVCGSTTTILSLTKPDYTGVAGGSVINQKFSPSAFSDSKRKKLIALLRVYFAKGGQEMQINATSRDMLNDAMKHPENYRDMIVRVSGFSARYVTLPESVQHDILNRTQQEA